MIYCSPTGKTGFYVVREETHLRHELGVVDRLPNVKEVVRSPNFHAHVGLHERKSTGGGGRHVKPKKKGKIDVHCNFRNPSSLK